MRSAQPAKILYCETNVDGTIGGSYYSLLYLVKGLDRTRYQPTVLFYADHALMGAFREAGAETIVWPRRQALLLEPAPGRALHWLRLPARAAQRAINFWRGYVMTTMARAWFLRRRGINIVHLNNSILYNHDWMAAATLTRKVCVCHERGINDAYTAAAKYFGKRLGAIVCISRAVYENMQQRGAGFANLVTIHNGLDPGTMRLETPPGQLRAAHGIPADALVVVMVGNIKPWKGQETLIRALGRVRQVVPNVRGVIVGDTAPADKDYEQQIRRLVADLALDDHMVFAGFRRNVTDYLMMSDVMVHASVLPEPFGRVILEAMACKKPVIGARAGAIPELVTDGENGLTFVPGDADGLAAAIIRVLENREEAQRLGQNGYERLIREFHIERNVESTERLYEELLSASR